MKRKEKLEEKGENNEKKITKETQAGVKLKGETDNRKSRIEK